MLVLLLCYFNPISCRLKTFGRESTSFTAEMLFSRTIAWTQPMRKLLKAFRTDSAQDSAKALIGKLHTQELFESSFYEGERKHGSPLKLRGNGNINECLFSAIHTMMFILHSTGAHIPWKCVCAFNSCGIWYNKVDGSKVRCANHKLW